MNIFADLMIDELMDSPVGVKLAEAMKAIETVQSHLVALAESDDSDKLKILKMATVFQIFLIDTLASGKKPKDLTKEDWQNIAEKVSEYAIMGDGQNYSEFVFTMYANYIDLSADSLQESAREESVAAIRELSNSIRYNTDCLHKEEISEVDYTESCLWLSLEGMIKILSCSLTSLIGPEFAYLTESVSQLAFEYGRSVLWAKEQALLEAYVQNQYELDAKLEADYKEYLAELEEYSERFSRLIDNAFSPDIRYSLMASAELAREVGVKEEELLLTVEDVDDFFM